MVGFDAFGDNRELRRFNSFNFFARGDGSSTTAPNGTNRRWLAVVDGSTKKVLYNQVLPDFFVDLTDSTINEIRAAVNSAELSIEVENFAAWAADRIPESDLRAENADADSDGMTNLFEYAYGTDPMVADSEKGPRIVSENGSIRLLYQRSLTALVDPLEIIGGSSPSSDLPFDTAGLEEVGEAQDGIESVTVNLPTAAGSRLFLRLTTSSQ